MPSPISKLIGPGSTQTSETLLERIGGDEPLDRIVNAVYIAMAKDKVIGKQFARFNLVRLKDRTVDYLRGEFGGEGYKGSDLWISHSHLGVNDQWYDIMMKYYHVVLKAEKVGKPEMKEIIESVEKMRVPIVDKGKKFKEMYLKWEEKQAKEGGRAESSWGTVASTKAEFAKKERDTLAMIAKAREEEMMAEERKKADEMWAKMFPNEGKGDAKPADAEGAEAEVAPKKKKKAKPKPPPVDWDSFKFLPEDDGPPESLPGSAPSAAEQMYRLTEYCTTPRGTPRGACTPRGGASTPRQLSHPGAGGCRSPRFGMSQPFLSPQVRA